MDEILSDYEKARNTLIPDAEEFANKKCRVKFPGGNEAAREAWTAKWNTTFHSRMNYLYRLARIICPTCGGKGTI